MKWLYYPFPSLNRPSTTPDGILTMPKGLAKAATLTTPGAICKRTGMGLSAAPLTTCVSLPIESLNLFRHQERAGTGTPPGRAAFSSCAIFLDPNVPNQKTNRMLIQKKSTLNEIMLAANPTVCV
jgi:hypothetical protein